MPSAPRAFSNAKTAWFLAACVLAAVVVIGNSDLVRGKAGPLWDADAYYGPLFSLVADYTKAAELFLWNPWMDAGSPDFADPQAGAASPVLLAFGLITKNPLHGFVAYWITFWIFGGVGMLLLCRHLKCPPWGGLVAALGFVASGFYTGHGQHTTILYSFSFVPWIVWRFDVAITRKSYWDMVPAGVLWGLSALGGYPALIIMDPMFLGLWGVGRVWLGASDMDSPTPSSRRKNLLFILAGLCLFSVIGVAVMSPSYVGFLVYTKGYTSRAGGISRSYALVDPLPPQALGTFASPFLYLLNMPPGGIWPETDISMSSIYMGVLVISLATCALIRRYKWRLWIGAIILFFLACAVGNHLPVRGWVYDLVLPTRYFRFPSLFSAYAIVGCCVLAAYGSRDVETAQAAGDQRSRGLFFVVSGMVATVAAMSYVWILKTAHLRLSGVKHPTSVFLLMWLSMVIVFVLRWRRDISYRLMVAALVVLSIYDATSSLKTGAATMYTPATLPWWHIMTSRHVKSLDLTPGGLDRELFPPDDLGRYQHNRNVVLKVPVFANDTGMVNPFFQAYVADPVLNQTAVGTQRIWFSDRPLWLPPNQKTFDEFVRTSHDLGIPPLILHSPQQMLAQAHPTSPPAEKNDKPVRDASSMSPANIALLTYTANHLAFVYNATEDGWLLVTDRWAPFWHATVNGRSVEIAGANFLFRAIPVSRGENTVLFQYEPRGYIGLLTLSWGIVILTIFGEILPRTMRRRVSARRLSSAEVEASVMKM